jgi:hypothetical protein
MSLLPLLMLLAPISASPPQGPIEGAAVPSEARLTGRVEGGAGAPVLVFTVAAGPAADGEPTRPSKADVYRAATAGNTTRADEDGAFELRVPPGAHAVFAFSDVDGDGCWDPGLPEPFGWAAREPAGRWEPVAVGATSGARVVIRVQAPRPFPRADRSDAGGTLAWHGERAVLHLSGGPRARGHAHGLLTAAQIVDFFRFYVLEDKLGSAREYLAGFAPFLESHVRLPEELATELDGVLEGMRASGIDLHIAELERDFSRTDLLAINAYIESRAMRSSCTQFAAWGARTAGTDVNGGMLTGRNMDGECDLRRVTVHHFLLMAVAPEGGKRFVSAMWPGFVGTLTGVNEDGLVVMENAGVTGPGPVVGGLVPFSWTVREALVRLDGGATPEAVERLLTAHANDVGGACGPGVVTLFAVPFHGEGTPAWVLEGDRFEHAVRRPGDVAPRLGDAILCSNHFLAYGCAGGGHAFGREPSFSSLWRYEAGHHTLDAWARTGRGVGTAEMRALLQTVAHGTTEHSIVTRPNQRELDVAVASLAAEPWDAPHRDWITFTFDELFAD